MFVVKRSADDNWANQVRAPSCVHQVSAIQPSNTGKSIIPRRLISNAAKPGYQGLCLGIVVY